MPEEPLSTLAIELSVQIFKSLDNFDTATSLSTTSRSFRGIYETHTISICFWILCRTVSCYIEAFEYVKAQPLEVIYASRIEDTTPVPIMVAKQFRKNANIACQALQCYESQMIECVSNKERMGRYESERSYRSDRISNPGGLTEAQRICFLQVWYRIHTIACLPHERIPYDVLAYLDILELEQMREVMCWLICICSEVLQLELCIRSHYEWLQGPTRKPEHLKWSIDEEDWNILNNHLNAQYRRVSKTYFNDQSRNDRATLFCFYDLYMDKKALNGRSMADLRPRTGERRALDRDLRFTPQRRVRKLESMNLE